MPFVLNNGVKNTLSITKKSDQSISYCYTTNEMVKFDDSIEKSQKKKKMNRAQDENKQLKK